jgi:hypothetical protein
MKWLYEKGNAAMVAPGKPNTSMHFLHKGMNQCFSAYPQIMREPRIRLIQKITRS